MILLTFNSSKTEFILIGIEQHLAKIHYSPVSLNTTYFAHNLIFDEHLSLSAEFSSLFRPWLVSFFLV